MAEQEQSKSQHELSLLDWSSWSVEPMQQYPPTTLPHYFPPFVGYDNPLLCPPYCNSPQSGSISTNQRYSGAPETSHQEESSNPEESTEVFSSPRYSHLKEEERFILNARLREEPWEEIEEACSNNFGSFPYKSRNALSMKVLRLKGKYPEVKAVLDQNNLTTKVGLSAKKKKRQTTRTSGADDDTAAANNGDVDVQQLSPEEAIRAAQTVLCFLGRPDCDGLVPTDDCMALIRILSQLNQLNRLK
ncbi:reverse transcriptase and RNase H [Colletotrichum higginsianum IMI 349063]|uniref:Reverse transcriptase and RNase H n=1 Tax=Colletotrichum higginsianum (strain IMI 349063) TaxID=759273 RepID=A0A1B7XQY5_COLHI|nr:reverse transcriptase and RNase H [Colletotrichum higginsianum IMI 349063]OBR02175.1 reverse transcriptase and RNase H [Colletotrichum higginsianum IMI 349063]